MFWSAFGDEPQEWANITGIDLFVPTIVRIQEHEIGDLIRHVFQNTVVFYTTIHVFTKAYLQFTAAKAKEQNNEIHFFSVTNEIYRYLCHTRSLKLAQEGLII